VITRRGFFFPHGTPRPSARFLICPLIGQIHAFRSFGPASDAYDLDPEDTEPPAARRPPPARKIYLKEGVSHRIGTGYTLSSQRLTALEDLTHGDSDGPESR
jgi:hypothetical protein